MIHGRTPTATALSLMPDRLDHPTPDLLILAYSQGIFPMADTSRRGAPISWFCPDPRGILPLDSFHIPASLGRVVRSRRFQITVDTAFDRVLDECASPRTARNRPWMNDRLRAAYQGLAQRGHAHSVEAWRDGQLVGGLYGVHLGAAFFGESMFSRPALGGTDASKVCLVHLVERLRAGGFQLLDTQFVNAHLMRFGVIEIPAEEYMDRLADALDPFEPPTGPFGDWHAFDRSQQTNPSDSA